MIRPSARVQVIVPQWFSELLKKGVRRTMQTALTEIDLTLNDICAKSSLHCQKILESAGIKKRTGKLFSAFSPEPFKFGLGMYAGKLMGRRQSGYTVITKGVGDMDILDKCLARDGKRHYWKMINDGYSAYDILPIKAGALKFGVNGKVLAGYRDPKGRGGRPYISKFRAYWAERPWAEGSGFFSHVFHPGKVGVHFMEKTESYMIGKVNRALPKILNRDFMMKGLKLYLKAPVKLV